MLNDRKFRERWGILYEMYRPECQAYYEFFAMIRRTLLITASVLLITYSRVQRYGISLIHKERDEMRLTEMR